MAYRLNTPPVLALFIYQKLTLARLKSNSLTNAKLIFDLRHIFIMSLVEGSAINGLQYDCGGVYGEFTTSFFPFNFFLKLSHKMA